MQPMQDTVDIEKTEAKGEANDKRVYELGYLLVPTIAEEGVPAVYSSLKDKVVSMGGELISDEMPKMINLAYSMSKVVSNKRNKYSTAYFGWVKFYVDSDKVLELKKNLDLDVNFIRFLILKTVKENTIAAKRFVYKDAARKKAPTTKSEKDEAAAPINKEEIDKEIDALVSA